MLVGYIWVDFEDCINDISILVAEATRLNMSTIICGDFNLSLGIGRRGECMNDLCHQFRLKIANGIGLGSEEVSVRTKFGPMQSTEESNYGWIVHQSIQWNGHVYITL